MTGKDLPNRYTSETKGKNKHIDISRQEEEDNDPSSSTREISIPSGQLKKRRHTRVRQIYVYAHTILLPNSNNATVSFSSTQNLLPC